MGLTMRRPTQDSAMLTRRLSWAHFRADWTSLRARSVRFCWRWIWTMRAMLYKRVLLAAATLVILGDARTLQDFPGACLIVKELLLSSLPPVAPPLPVPALWCFLTRFLSMTRFERQLLLCCLKHVVRVLLLQRNLADYPQS